MGFLSYPGGEYRLLTHDTNDYGHPSLAADGKTMVANQTKLSFELDVAAASLPSELKPVPLSSHMNLWRWGWMADGRLIVPQKLRQQVGLTRDAVVVGVSDRLEIWAGQAWDRYEDSRMGAYMAGALDAPE